MKKIVKKYKAINLITGLLSIIAGLIFFTIIYIDYQNSINFYEQADVSQGYVFNVRQKEDNVYSYEYKYIVRGDEYKNYVKEEKREDKLEENQILNVYYNDKNPTENILSKPGKRNLYISIGFLVFFIILGLLNILKYFKK